MQGERSLIRAVGAMSAVTASSRVLGYARDTLQAALLGAAHSSDAFVIAYRIPNMLRRLVAEGAVTSTFVPEFTGLLQGRDRRSAWRFAGSMVYVLSAALAALVVLGVLGSPWLVRLLAWGLAVSPATFDLTVALNRLMLPYVLFISLSAVAAGMLNAFEFYALPAATPILLNLAVIASALALRDRFPDPSFAFAFGVLTGGVLQLAVQVPLLLRLGLDLRPPRPFDVEGVRRVVRVLLPRMFGAGITQVNLVVDTQFAAALRPGSVSFLYYAVRVTELTLGLFAVSLSTVLLPRLSRAAGGGDLALVRATLGTALRLLLFVTIPATIGLVILRVPIIHVLFERGRFGAADTALTAGALGWYAIGLLPYAAIGILATAFHAFRDTRTPMRLGLLTFAAHLGLNAALSGPMGHAGIALSTSLTAWLDATLLLLLLRRRAGPIRAGLPLTAARSLGAGGVMAVVLALVSGRMEIGALQGFALKGAALGAMIGGGAVVYLGAHRLLGGREAGAIAAALRKDA
ncbi:MAG: murein biosynthesis integral membrane protein MurJ [Candidatus Polarisedimenticolia bacterium]